MGDGQIERARPATARSARLEARLDAGPALLLDGATGTELERRGVRSVLPLWSTHALLEAPDALREVHAEYVMAGAEVLTANTFRTQRRVLARAEREGSGLAQRDAELTRRAVEIAREAAASATHPVWIAGSAPTLEDCYRPDRVPEPTRLDAEHARHAENLAAAAVDLVLIETMNTIREAEAAARAAMQRGLPAIVSFVCGPDARLLSGEPLSEAIARVGEYAPLAIGVNCLPPSAVGACLAVLRRSGLRFGVYANLGEPGEGPCSERSEQCTPERFADYAREWLAAGARYIGGCCGTTPAHIRALAATR